MKTAKQIKTELRYKINTVTYVTKRFPDVTVDENRMLFSDKSITIDDFDDVEFHINEHFNNHSLVLGSVYPFKNMKRRPNEENPIKIYSSKNTIWLQNKYSSCLTV